MRIFSCILFFYMSKLSANHGKSAVKSSASGSGFGDIAQLVEQMTFNHWVQSSSLCVPTKINRCMAVFFLNNFTWCDATKILFATYLLPTAVKNIAFY